MELLLSEKNQKKFERKSGNKKYRRLQL